MSSSYCSLDWVLSHWVHFTVHLFICVYLCVFCVFLFYTAYVLYCWEHSGVDLMGLKPNPWDLSSFSALTLLVGSFDLEKLVPNMTYNVFGAQSINYIAWLCVWNGYSWQQVWSGRPVCLYWRGTAACRRTQRNIRWNQCQRQQQCWTGEKIAVVITVIVHKQVKNLYTVPEVACEFCPGTRLAARSTREDR